MATLMLMGGGSRHGDGGACTRITCLVICGLISEVSVCASLTVGKPSERSCATQYLGLKPLTNLRKAFVMLARLMVIPQIVWILSGLSLVACAGTDRGAREDTSIESQSASEKRLALLERKWGGGGVQRTHRCEAQGEWISPRLFLGIAMAPVG